VEIAMCAARLLPIVIALRLGTAEALAFTSLRNRIGEISTSPRTVAGRQRPKQGWPEFADEGGAAGTFARGYGALKNIG
jgi:hypothetical protein